MKYDVNSGDLDTEPWTWGAVQIATRVTRGDLTARDVVESHLARLDDRNPHLNAVTRVDPEAVRAAADAVDQALAAGLDVGPLAGVPVTIKDNADVAGETTPNGIPALNERLAPSSAPFVEHLQRAGAIVLGRTNTPDFSWRWHTDNPLFGPTVNPWNASVTPGGSSGGAAAALAAGIGGLAHGNDAGGSLRWPAACCGLSTIRPTQGRVASHNVSAPAERSLALDLVAVQGPLGRSVADTRLGLDVMARPTWRDPNYVPAPLEVQHRRRAGIHLGAGAPLEPTVGAAVDEAARRLEAAGWTVTEIDVPDLELAAHLWARLLNTDFHHTTRADFIELGSPPIELMLDVLDTVGPALTMPSYIEALQARTTLLRKWQHLLTERVDVVVMPVAMERPWPVGDDSSSRARLEQIYAANTPLVAINGMGLPAAAQPTGVVDGLPAAVQIVAARFHESVALDAAEAIEAGAPVIASLWDRE